MQPSRVTLHFQTFCALAVVLLAAFGCAKRQPETIASSGSSTSLTQCTICHGSRGNAAPPRNTSGKTSSADITIGAHQSHLAPTIGKPVACGECHVVPLTITEAGHILHQPARVVFGATASIGLSAIWDRATGTCTTYCHGASQPVWTKVDGSQKQCTSCHGFPPPAPHIQSSDPNTPLKCSICHGEVVSADGSILDANKHINGVLNTVGMSCSSCHGSPQNPAPPKDTKGQSATTNLSVGAHQQHLNATLGPAVPCSECHVVPGTVGEAGHILGTRARVALGPLSQRSGVAAAYDPATGTCVTFCHGASNHPIWNKVDGSQKQCNSCHGFPPAAPHIQNIPANDCSKCHGDVVAADYSIIDQTKHINGVVNTGTMTCTSCHGSSGSPAPATGAHQQHLNATIGKVVACSECHVVPAAYNDAGHNLGTRATVTLGSVSKLAGVSASYDPATYTCVTFCHGQGFDMSSRGTTTRPVWTKVDGTQKQCTSCHTIPPNDNGMGHDGSQCLLCHPGGYSPTSVNAATHIDGQIHLQQKCTSCHAGMGMHDDAAPYEYPVSCMPVASSATSVIGVTPGSAFGGGAMTSIVTLVVKNPCGTALSGRAVTLVSSRGATDTIVANIPTTNASGVAQFTVTWGATGAATLTATVSSDAMTLAKTVNVSSVTTVKATLVASPSSGVPADGDSSSTITITVTDGAGIPVSGMNASTIQIVATGSENALVQPSGPTSAAGETTARISTTVAESKSVSLAAPAYMSASAISVSFGSVAKRVFKCSGGLQSFTVPTGATAVTVKAWGAGGSYSSTYDTPDFYGAPGGYARGTFAVVAGQVLTFNVGTPGGTPYYGNAPISGGAGWPDGGAGTCFEDTGDFYCKGGGGGASSVVRAGTLLLAAGGGAGANHVSAAAAPGGSWTCTPAGAPAGVGSDAAFGGGGGGACGGNAGVGGASYVNGGGTLTSGVMIGSVHPGNESDSDNAGAGYPGTCGRVVITWQ